MNANFNSRIKQNRAKWRVNDAVMRVMLWPKALIDRIFPQGSSIRRYYGLAVSGVQIIILYGWGSFWRRYRHYQQTEKNVSKWRTQLVRDAEQKVFKIEPEQFLLPKKLKVAVVVHSYYTELFGEICTYLKNMPCSYTLFVSIKSKADMQAINAQLQDLPMLERAVVKVVANRGRDIAPFLVDFASELADYDYICKVHTKKSLFTGSEKMEWRQYLYKMLLGSKQRIQAILTVFARDASVGIIYPARYEHTPYWAYTWLSNKWDAAPFVNRLGFDFDPDEYIDYPTGSMFWIKKEALKPLFDMRLARNDFPEERGQTDGALHHIMERCFTLSARSRGFKYTIINDLNDDVFSYSDARKVSSYFNVSPADLIQHTLPLVDVVSFDIFDTLLCRPFASPDKLLQYIEEAVHQRYGVKDFMRLRQQAEADVRLRQGHLGDVKISQIYQALASAAGISWEVAEKILEFELTTEIELLIPRPDMLAAFEEVKGAGKRIILTTDTYFEKPHIERILMEKGLSGYHQLYISSEEGRLKDRGDMWDYIIEHEGIRGSNLLHIGDNEQSDVQLLGDRGPYFIVHVMKPSVLFRQSAHGNLLWQMLNPREGWRENLLYGMISNHFCLDTYPFDFWYCDKPLSDPFTLGYTVFGPLMHNFLAWLINYARLDGVKRLYFLSREGYALHKMYQDIAGSAALRQPNINLPAGSYLLSSRRTALFAVLKKEEDLLPFLDRDFNGTLRNFFEKRLNISVANMQAVEKVVGEEGMGRQISLPSDYDMVKKSLLNVFDILAPQAEAEREALLAYCKENGLLDKEKMGLVDIGYSCTIQKSLIGLLDRPLNGYYFAIDDKAGKIRDGSSQARGYLGELLNPKISAVVIFKHSLLLEAVLTAPDGQLLYFSGGKDGAVPVFKQPGLAQKRFDVITRIHDGMGTFVRDMLKLFGAAALEIEFPVSDMLHYYQMIATGRVDLGDLKKVLSVEDEYSGLPEIEVIDYYTKLYDSQR
ncbi:MAG: rhamnan synthesis F family protein [Dehalococcoidia bacterium]